MLKRKFIIFFVIFLFLIVSSITYAETTKKLGEINVGVEAGGPYSEFYKRLAPEFTKMTGVTVNFIEVPHENMHERFIIEAFAGTGAIDVYQADQPWISEFADLGFLEPLDKLISPEDLADFFPAALETVKYQGKIYALPYLTHTPIIYYRTDLFEKAGLTEPPKTWEEYREYAKKLTDAGSDIYGTIIESKQHPEPVTHFLDLLFQAGGAVLDENNKVVIDSPAALSVLNLMLAIQQEDKSSPAGAVGYDCVDVHISFLQGKVAMVRNWPYMYSMAKDPEQSKVAGLFDVAVQQAGVEQTSAIWSWGYGVSTSSKNKDAAWAFVKWSTSSDVVKRLGTEFTNPVPRSSALDAIKADTSLNKIDMKAISVMSEAVSYGKNATTNPKFPALQSRLSETISKVMSLQSSPEDELKATATDMVQIMEK